MCKKKLSFEKKKNFLGNYEFKSFNEETFKETFCRQFYAFDLILTDENLVLFMEGKSHSYS